MATQVEGGLIEVADKLQTLAPALIGLRNLAEMSAGMDPGDLSPRAHQDVLDSITNYDRRVKLLNAHKASGDALMADGHPNMPPTVIDQDALASILANAATVQLAAATFVTNTPAGRLEMSSGGVEPK